MLICLQTDHSAYIIQHRHTQIKVRIWPIYNILCPSCFRIFRLEIHIFRTRLSCFASILRKPQRQDRRSRLNGTLYTAAGAKTLFSKIAPNYILSKIFF